VVVFAGQATANPIAKEPFEMVRALQSAQEQVASGSDSAAAMQRALLEKMDEAFLQLPPEAWQDPRNARASVIHLLSGGNPEVVRHLLTLTPAPVIDLNLMEASLAYVEGREEDMLTRLADVDPLNLPPSLGGHIALVKAVPYIQTDPVRAMELCRSRAC
jgi:chemotaxis protein MotC